METIPLFTSDILYAMYRILTQAVDVSLSGSKEFKEGKHQKREIQFTSVTEFRLWIKTRIAPKALPQQLHRALTAVATVHIGTAEHMMMSSNPAPTSAPNEAPCCKGVETV